MVTLHELVSTMDTYADALLRRDYAMSFNEFEYLVVVGQLDRPDITEVAACLRLTKAAVSKRLPALEAAGLVRRAADPTHGRRVLVALTPLGAERLKAAGARLEAELAGVFAPTDEAGHRVDPVRINTDLETLLSRIKDKELDA